MMNSGFNTQPLYEGTPYNFKEPSLLEASQYNK
jgi:hypothetical protein